MKVLAFSDLHRVMSMPDSSVREKLTPEVRDRMGDFVGLIGKRVRPKKVGSHAPSGLVLAVWISSWEGWVYNDVKLLARALPRPEGTMQKLDHAFIETGTGERHSVWLDFYEAPPTEAQAKTQSKLAEAMARRKQDAAKRK